MWLLLGLHLVILMAAFTTLGPLAVAAAVGGMGLAWAAGIAFLPAPAGAGVREAVLMLTLSPFIGREAALAIAITSRALLVLVDVALAAHRRRPVDCARVQDRTSKDVCSGYGRLGVRPRKICSSRPERPMAAR